jgi:hypothetical protein
MVQEVQLGSHQHAPDTVFLRRQKLGERVGAHAGGPDDQAGANLLAGGQLDAAGGDPRHTSLGAQGNTFALQLAAGARGESRVDAGEDLRSGFEQHQRRVGGLKAAAARDEMPEDEVVQLGDDFNSGVPAADHSDAQQVAAALRVGFVVGVLEEVEDVIAEHDGILEGEEREAVLDTLNAEIVGDAAEGEN